MQEEKRENFFTELLKFIALAVVIVASVRLWVAQPFFVSGESMNPTFTSGQYLIIDELTYHFAQPKRGDVTIFRYPKNPSEFFIKRIIGLPGETVQISNSAVSIVEPDGSKATLPEPYLVHTGNGLPQSTKLGPGEYFVMGDNRTNSSDSRFWGSVPRQNIIGRVFVRLLPVQAIALFPGSFNFAPIPNSTIQNAVAL